MTTWWLDSDGVVTIVNWRQQGDYTTILAAQLPCCRQLITVNTLSLSSYHVVIVQQSDWCSRFAVYEFIQFCIVWKKNIMFGVNRDVARGVEPLQSEAQPPLSPKWNDTWSGPLSPPCCPSFWKVWLCPCLENHLSQNQTFIFKERESNHSRRAMFSSPKIVTIQWCSWDHSPDNSPWTFQETNLKFPCHF